jgi:staphylococcal nuclease domain-containing protein 1
VSDLVERGKLEVQSLNLAVYDSAPDTNVSHKILSAGWARVHDSGSRRNANAMPEEEEEGGWKANQRQVQDEAQKSANGVWGPDELLKVEHNMGDASTFLSDWKGKEIESVVEQVRDGSMLRVRLFLSPRHHQVVNLSLAGIKAPRMTGAGGPNSNEPSEAFAEEARFFVESRLLQRNVKVVLLSMPQPAAVPTPFGSTAAVTPSPMLHSSSVLIGQMHHPVGDIAQFLLQAGLAKCVDWHAGLLAGAGGMEKYRLAEKVAKDKRLNIWKDYKPATKGTDTLIASPASRTFDATVIRIISGDTIHVRRNTPANSPEQRLHLSSIRQPVVKDEKQAGYAHEAREFLRKRLVGKPVSVRIDYIKKEPGNDDRIFASVKTTTGSKESRGTEIGELLLERGLATVMRHRASDEDRSPDWDKLMTYESEAITAKKGLHSGKEMVGPKYVEASESATKAYGYLTTLKRQGRVHAIVDFCASASRFKVIIPKENCRITFVLAGVKAPKTARNAQEKDEPFAREGLAFSTQKALQRDVEVEILSTDKVGGFIGAMYLNKSDNLAVDLVESGLVSLHRYSAETLSFGNQLMEAENKAKAAKAGMWINAADDDETNGASMGDYTNGSNGSAAASSASAIGTRSGWGAASATTGGDVQPRTEYVDIVISDVRGDGGSSIPFSFSIQILDDKISQLETLMNDLAVHHQNSTSMASSTVTFQPKVGDWVSAKFSGDNQWYRGQVLRNKPAQKAREIKFVDYGNIEDVPVANIKALDSARFGKNRLPSQSTAARLSFVKLYEGKGVPVSNSTAAVPVVQAPDDYALDAQERFKELTEGRKLIANIDYR